jgi:hypothetical protein
MSYTEVRYCGSRPRLVLCTLLVVIAVTGTARAQDWSALAGLGPSFASGITITPQVEAGYQRLGLSFNLPATRPFSSWPSTLDLALRKADLWCGSLDAIVDFPSGLSFGLKGQTNAPSRAYVYEGQEYTGGGAQGVHWTADKMQWWTIDGRVMYRFRPGVSAVAGLRREQLSFDLTDPINDQGETLNLDDSGYIWPGFPALGTYKRHWRYASNVSMRAWVPYLGVDFVGTGFKASLIASPCASVDVKVPAEFLMDLIINSFGTAQIITDEELEYRVTKPAVFLEANLSHEINVSQALNLSVWGTASWLRLRGKGTWNYHYTGQVPPDPPGSESLSDTNTATFTRYLLGGGLSAVVSF